MIARIEIGCGRHEIDRSRNVACLECKPPACLPVIGEEGVITSLPEGLEVEAGIEMHAERAGADRFWHWPPRVVRRGRFARRGRQIKRYSRSLQTNLQAAHQHRTQFAQPCIIRDGLQMFETETAKFDGVSHIAGIVAGDVQQQPCWRVMVSVKDMVDEATGEFGVCRPAMAAAD